ncbi:MAG: hypothetical protein AABY26_00245, partial [Nanoarchaeota archaeon]
ALTGLAVLVSAGCVHRAEQREEPYQEPSAPLVYARQDYGLGWDKEVALYNIQQILKDVTFITTGGNWAEHGYWGKEHEYSTDAQGILEVITPYSQTEVYDPKVGRMVATMVSSKPETSEFINWSCIKQTTFSQSAEAFWIDFEIDQKECPGKENKRIFFREGQQAAGAEQAIDIYLRERKK